MWPRSCRSAAVISAASAPAACASVAVCSACSSWVTGSPLYMRSPLAANTPQMSSMLSAIAVADALPWQRVGLGVGEALHCFLHAFLVAQARILDPAERRQFQAITRDLAHVDAAHVEFR